MQSKIKGAIVGTFKQLKQLMTNPKAIPNYQELIVECEKSEKESETANKIVTITNKERQELEKQLFRNNQRVGVTLANLAEQTNELKRDIESVIETLQKENGQLDHKQENFNKYIANKTELIFYYKNELEKLNTNLRILENEEKNTQIQAKTYSELLDKSKAELSRIEEKVGSISQETQVIELNNNYTELTEKGQFLLSQARLLESHVTTKNAIANYENLLMAERIKLKDCQEKIVLKKTEIKEQQTIISRDEALIAEKQKSQKEIRLMQKANGEKISYLQFLIREDENGYSMPIEVLQKSLEEFRLSSQNTQEITEPVREFVHESPRAYKARITHEKIRDLLNKNYLTDAENIKIHLYSLIDQARVEEFFAFLQEYVDQDTGFIKTKLDALKSDQKFLELCRLIGEYPEFSLDENLLKEEDYGSWRALYQYKKPNDTLFESHFTH